MQNVVMQPPSQSLEISLEQPSTMQRNHDYDDHIAHECTHLTPPTDEANFPKERVTMFVMKELNVKLQYGHPQAELEHHLKNVSDLLGEKMATTWSDVMRLLRGLGYTDPTHYKVCVCGDHSVVLQPKAPACHVCAKLRGACMDYYVLGLGFKDWFCTDERCDQLMAHWREKDDWMNGTSTDVRLTEVWHGERFQELSYFWDPLKITLMPHKCNFCGCIIPSNLIEQAVTSAGGTQLTLCCPTSKTECTFCAKYIQGDPRNQAIIIHEDGWASHNTSAKHSVAAITITTACMLKLNRSFNKNAQVYSFIPSDQLPRHAPHKFDAFLEPLVNEIKDLYIDGAEVFFKSPVSGYSPACDTAVLRVVPLLFTADLRAHAEIGLSSAGGRKGCRRCNVVGTYVQAKNHYYYGNFHYRYHQRASLRTAQSNRQFAKQVDSAATESERKRLAREHGITGESIFYQLFDLCGFDPVKDMVIDAMHAVSLNLIRSELEKHLLAELCENSTVDAVDRDAEVGGLLSRGDLAQSLKVMDWPTEFKDGRVPAICPSEPSGPHKLGFWKSEEFSKLALVAPYVLHSIIPKKAYDCFVLLSDIHKLVSSRELRFGGWTQEHITALEVLLWKHAILLEMVYGISACTENVECSLHMVEDIRRHSTLDNYWCFVYERLVKFYKNQTSNMKQLCKTFANRANQLRFVNIYLETHSGTKTENEDFSLEQLSSEYILESKTEESGIKLKEFLSTNYKELSETLKEKYKSGILLGCPKQFLLSTRQKLDITHWIRQDNPNVDDSELGSFAVCYSRVLKCDCIDQAVTFRKGEHAIIVDSDVQDREWVIKLTNILVYGPVVNKYYSFLEGDYYVSKSYHGEIQYDEWTKQPMMVPRNFVRLRVQPLCNLNRKVVLYPMPQLSSCPSYYLVVDFSELPTTDISPIPYFPKIGDIIKVGGELVHVHQIDNGIGKGYMMKKVRGETNKYKLTDKEKNFSLMAVDSNIDYVENIGVYSINY